jgi:hypothetical protein
MTRTAICSCGYTFSYRDDAEYYGLVRRHVIPLEREKHHLIATRAGKPAVEVTVSERRPAVASAVRLSLAS